MYVKFGGLSQHKTLWDYDPINAHYIWDLYRIFPYRGMFGIGVHPTITLQATGRFSPPSLDVYFDVSAIWKADTLAIFLAERMAHQAFLLGGLGGEGCGTSEETCLFVLNLSNMLRQYGKLVLFVNFI